MSTYEYGLWSAAYQLNPWSNERFETQGEQEAAILAFVNEANQRVS